MRTLALGIAAASALVAGCTQSGLGLGLGSGYGAYDYDRPDPSYGGYHADRYYRDDPNRRERRLSRNERVYRGQDGRYYCRQSDGTTGLIVGGVAGGILGNILAPGRSETLGTLLGAAGGAVAGRAVDRNQSEARCR